MRISCERTGLSKHPRQPKEAPHLARIKAHPRVAPPPRREIPNRVCFYRLFPNETTRVAERLAPRVSLHLECPYLTHPNHLYLCRARVRRTATATAIRRTLPGFGMRRRLSSRRIRFRFGETAATTAVSAVSARAPRATRGADPHRFSSLEARLNHPRRHAFLACSSFCDTWNTPTGIARGGLCFGRPRDC